MIRSKKKKDLLRVRLFLLVDFQKYVFESSNTRVPATRVGTKTERGGSNVCNKQQ